MRTSSKLKPRAVTVLSRADVMDVCQVMLQRCGLTAVHLVEHMGEQLPAPVATVVVTTNAAPAYAANLTPRQSAALAYAERPGGVSIDELQLLMDIGMQTAFSYVDALVKRGRVTRVKQLGVRGSRYFANPDDARACVPGLAVLPAPAAEPTATRHIVMAPAQPIPDMPPATPTITQNGAAKREAAPIRYSDKFEGVQRAKTPVDTRFCVADGEQLTGGFSTSRPGIDPITGRPWGSSGA